jgi:hypothetical protein
MVLFVLLFGKASTLFKPAAAPGGTPETEISGGFDPLGGDAPAADR